MHYKHFDVNTKTEIDKTNFAKFYGTFQTKCKALGLSEAKDFCKDDFKQTVVVLQSSREIYSISLKNN